MARNYIYNFRIFSRHFRLSFFMMTSNLARPTIRNGYLHFLNIFFSEFIITMLIDELWLDIALPARMTTSDSPISMSLRGVPPTFQSRAGWVRHSAGRTFATELKFGGGLPAGMRLIRMVDRIWQSRYIKTNQARNPGRGQASNGSQ